MTPQELKNSILQLAIQGKLVEQRPEEGTAEELYQKIQEEKQRLIKAGKIKKEKPLPEISEDEMPFQIPKNWKWVRVCNLAFLKSGNQYQEDEQGHLYVKVADMNLPENQFEIVTASRRADIPESDLIPKNSIIFPKRGGAIATNKKRLVLLEDIGVDSNTMSMTIIDERVLPYVLKWFSCIDLGKLSTGTSVPQINNKDINPLLIPFPPLAEQKRIVSKIEELLPYIDRYEQAWSKLENFNKSFPEDMQKSILQMAIQGKLVEQRPEEGTAEKLYQQIQTEKRQLIKTGKIKKDNLLPEITEDEEPFDIPENWMWVRLGEITQFQGGYAFKSSTYVPLSNNQVIRLGNVKPNTLLLDEKQVFIPDDIASTTIDYKLKENDILVTMTGTRKKRDYFFTLAVSAKDLASRNLFLNQRVGCLRIYGLINIKYLLCVLQNEHIKDLIFAKETGTANQGNIGSEDIKCSILVPLPPLAEQKRIVTKLEEILPLCEKLI